MPTLSVVIPAYNVEQYIEAAIDSVLAQTKPFYEIIIVNDGSTDATAARLEKYAYCPTVRLIHTKNQGLGPTRNEGVRHASGDFVYFLDADDVIVPHFVAALNSVLENTPNLDLIFFSGEIFYDDDYPRGSSTDARVDEFYRDLDGIYPSGIDAAAAMLQIRKFSPSACLYISRRAFWENSLQFKPIIHEDDEVIMQLCALARTTRIFNEIFYMRRIRNGSIMSTKRTRRNALGYFEALSSTWNLYQQISSRRHQTVLETYFWIQVWQYLQICKIARLKPTVAEAIFLARRFRYIPKADFIRTLLPQRSRSMIRRVRQLLTFSGSDVARNAGE